MNIKLLTEHHLEFLSLKEVAQACLSLFMSKCHIAGNHMSRLIYFSINWSGLVYKLLNCLVFFCEPEKLILACSAIRTG